MNVKFEKIRYKNILSTGETFTEIDLSTHKTNLIIGKNGAGKSTFLDAISFALYGKPFRKITKPQLVNSTNGKGLLVELDFLMGKDAYKVIRGIKPNKFEIYKNDEMIDQNAKAAEYQRILTEDILKLNHKAFGQIVVLGSATFVPFMELDAADRRSFIEELLDIKVCTDMNKALKDQISDHKKNLSNLDNSLEMAKQKLESANEHNALIDKAADSKKRDIQESIDQANEYHDRINDEIEEYKSKLSDYSVKLEKLESKEYEEKYHEAKSMRSVKYNKKAELEKNLRFYTDNLECPTCKAPISAETKIDNCEELEGKIAKIDEAIENIDKAIEMLGQKVLDIRKYKDNVMSVNNIIKSKKDELDSWLKVISDNEAKLDKVDEIEEKKDVEPLQAEVKSVTEDLKKEKDKGKYYKVLQAILKDSGVKASIIKQYTDVINMTINKYLERMEFYVKFTLDEEFNETILSRFRDNFTYNSFSQGEKLRIDLALMFTWREIARMRNSINTNLLIMDEVFDSSLDDSGTDELLSIISDLTEDSNAFIISHSNLHNITDSFDRVLEFDKVKGFTRMNERK